MTFPTRYQIIRVDVGQDTHDIRVDGDAAGFALELFRDGLPVGFLLRDRVEGDRDEVRDALFGVLGDANPSADRSQSIPAEAVPPITVAICTKDHPDLLARCLDGLGQLDDRPPGIEVLVVDNASSTSETRVVAEAHEGVRYVRESRLGLNFARNRALAEADHGILAFIDDDAVVDRGWLNGLRMAWARAPNAGGFTGQVLPYELESEAQVLVERLGGFRKGFSPVIHGRDASNDPLFPVTTNFGNGCNMAFDVAKMRAIGGFDTALDMGHYLPGGGDLDALYSVVRAGHALVYEPAMLVRHQHRIDMAGLRRQIRMSWGAGTMAFLTKIRDQDPEFAPKARQFIAWWQRDLIRQLVLRRRDPGKPWRISAEEMFGVLIGLNGLYRRAQARAEAIDRSAREH